MRGAVTILLLVLGGCSAWHPANECAHDESRCDGDVAHDCAETGGGRSSFPHLAWSETDCAASGQSCFLAGESENPGAYPMAICALRDERCDEQGDSSWCEATQRVACYRQTQLESSWPQVVEDCAASGRTCVAESQGTYVTTRCE